MRTVLAFIIAAMALKLSMTTAIAAIGAGIIAPTLSSSRVRMIARCTRTIATSLSRTTTTTIDRSHMTRPLDRESRVYWWEEFLTMPPILNPETARSAAWIHAEFQGYPAAARKSNGRWRFLAVILRTLCSARTSGWQTAWPYYYKSVLKRSCQLGSCASRSRSWMCVPSSSPLSEISSALPNGGEIAFRQVGSQRQQWERPGRPARSCRHGKGKGHAIRAK